jgi:hypothetical protein
VPAFQVNVVDDDVRILFGVGLLIAAGLKVLLPT